MFPISWKFKSNKRGMTSMAMTGKNVFLALSLSMFLTLVLTVLYAFYPVWSAILGIIWRSMFASGPESSGITAVAGGMSGSSLKILLVEPLLFLLIFMLLQRRSVKSGPG